MTIVNRLSPLIVRRTGRWAAALPMAAGALPFEPSQAAAWFDDLRLFATGWAGGLVFFGTLFG